MLEWHMLLGAGTAGAAGEGGAQSMLPTLVTFGLIFVVFYFLIIRPQSKKQKETQKMIQSLKKGDKAQTIGGIHGTVQSVKDQTVVLRVADNVDMEFTKNAIGQVTSAEEVKSGESISDTESKPSNVSKQVGRDSSAKKGSKTAGLSKKPSSRTTKP